MKVKFDEIFIVDNSAIYTIVNFSGKRVYYYLASKSKKILKRIGPVPSRQCYLTAKEIFFEKNFDVPVKQLTKIKKSNLLNANLNIDSNNAYKKRIELLNIFGIQYLQHGFLLITSRRKKGKNCLVERVKDLNAAIRQQEYIAKTYNGHNAITTNRHAFLKNEHGWLNASLKTAAANINSLVNRRKILIKKHQKDVSNRLDVIKKHLEDLWPAPYYYRAREALAQLEDAKKSFSIEDYEQMRRDLSEAHRWLLKY